MFSNPPDKERKKVFLKNFGCKTNFFDMFSILGRMKAMFDIQMSDFENADIVILNSCSVTHGAERELHRWLKKAKKRNKTVVVTGCLPNLKDIRADMVFGAGTYHRISRDMFSDEKLREITVKLKDLRVPPQSIEEDLESCDFDHFPRSRAYIKIQEGCSRFCSFCSIPLTRGLPRYISEEKIVSKIRELAEQGFKEFVLVGTHLSLYGQIWVQESDEIRSDSSLGRLAKRLAREFYGEKLRIKFSSLSPKEIEEDFLEGLELGRDLFSPHFHLSVQSGSNRVLRLMRRWHTFEDFLNDSKKLLKIFPDACIGTDLIAGFPGETERDFEETVENLKKSPVGHVHVFPFSARPRTPAFLMKRIPEEIIKVRSETLMKISEEKRKDFVERNIGKIVQLLVEKVTLTTVEGTTPNYINVLIYAPDTSARNEIREGEYIECTLKKVVRHNGKIYAVGEIHAT